MRTILDRERRARLARRHGIAPALRHPDALTATRAMTVLHATEPATVHLALQARVDGLGPHDVDTVLYEHRALVKQLAMRRTLFVFPCELLPAAWGSASARVAAQQRARLVKQVVACGLAADGPAWLHAAGAAVETLLVAEGELGAQAVREALPDFDVTVDIAPGTAYGGPQPVVPRVLTVLGAEGRIVRGRNSGHWRVSRPRWTTMESWLGPVPTRLPAAEGYAALVRRWLWSFGPGTTADLQWWLGATRTATVAALAAVGAVEVTLEDGASAWLLPDDVDPEPDVEPWAALLPVLDPTVMGWKERDFYLGPHATLAFDRNGNAGTTVWWDGRVVGAWVQDANARVVTSLFDDVPSDGRRAIENEADRLTAWLAGEKVGTVYPSQAMKAARETAT